MMPDQQANVRGLDIRHVLVASNNTHPTGANGVHNVARQLIREQVSLGQGAGLHVLTPHPELGSRDYPEAARILPLAGLGLRGRTLMLSPSRQQALCEGATAATIFHLHTAREPLLIGLCRALRRRGLAYVITVHGRYSHAYDAEGRRTRLTTAGYLEVFERPMLEAARFVQALSEPEAAVLRRVAPGAAIRVIGNGAYSSQLGDVPPPPGARGPSGGFPHFAYCGRYELGHKGLDLLLEGFAAYRGSGGTGKLTMMGTGPARAVLVDLAARLGVAESVAVHGGAYGSERDAALRPCDFFVMASRFEGLPLAALEAAILGLPLIMSEGTGLREAVVRHGAGIPIAGSSAAAVCQALHAAGRLDPVAWRAQAAAAYRMALALGDWSTIAARLLALYHQRQPMRPDLAGRDPACLAAAPTS